MKLIKFLFWVCATVILAYYMTDLKIGGKTLKQNIDDFIKSDQGVHLKERSLEWVNEKLGDKPVSSKASEPASAASKPQEPAPAQPTTKPTEDISGDDASKLKHLFN